MAQCNESSRAICTITTRSHIKLVRCLMNSFFTHHPEGIGYVLYLDDVSQSDELDSQNIRSIHSQELRIAEFPSMAKRYNTFELCNGLKPFLLQYLLAATDHQKLCYVDSDICIFASLDEEVWNQLDSCSLLLTPHLCRLPDGDPDLVWRDLAVLQHGVYNAGFIGIHRSPGTQEFLQWWQSRIIPCGYKKLEEGMNCDQRWLDLVPGFALDTKISRHPGLNAAYWNLHERQFTSIDGRHLVNGQPLGFFHFSGYSVDHPSQITKHWTRFTFENRPDVKPVFDDYHEQLTRAAQAPAVRERPRPHLFPLPRRAGDDEGGGRANSEGGFSSGQTTERAAKAFERTARDRDEEAKHIDSVPSEGKSNTTRSRHHLISPDVSVVIPAFNAARYLGQAIESVLQQTVTSREIIVMDDGSTDDTESILGSYGNSVRHISQSHAGVSAARNRGIEEARGEFVAFLDADDYFLLSTKLEEQLACFERRPELGIVHSGWRVTDESGEILVDKKPWTHAPHLNLQNWLLWQAVLPSAMMFRRDALVDVGHFDSHLAHLEDVDLVLRLSLKGYASTWLKKITVAHRRHSGNASLEAGGQDRALTALLDRFFSQAGLPDDIKKLEHNVRYNTLVWTACQYYRAGRFDEMARRLSQSLLYSELSTSDTMLDWIERFRGNYAENFGTQVSVFDLTELDEWQQIVRSHLIGTTPEGAFFPSPRPKLTADWTLPLGPSPLAPAHSASTTRIVERPERDNGQATCRQAAPVHPAKLNLSGAFEGDYGRHRSGWRFALESLRVLHHEQGVFVDAFPEHTFGQPGRKPRAAYRQPWIGFFHNPPNMPPWFISSQSPQRIWVNEEFQESLHFCPGVFCLSEYHKQWLQKHLNVPVVSLLHPTVVPEKKFSIEAFHLNPDKKIVQIGTWLRKLHSIYYLPATRLKKAILHQQAHYVRQLFAAEERAFQLEPDYTSVETLPFLSDEQYDDLLCRNIAYVELYDSSANNAVIECIVRDTPILVNPLPAVREYLGEDYPFYFVHRSQAARKAEDPALIEATHRYLQKHPIKEKLTAAHFLKSVAESEIYQNLSIRS
jgi:glycosyltransferase involved in cell wall biosynthesis